MPEPTPAHLLRRISAIADAFGCGPDDQRDLCIKAREAGSIIEIQKRQIAELEAVIRNQHMQRCVPEWTGRGLHAPECLVEEKKLDGC